MDAEILLLSDNRKLSCAEYGKPDGMPVFIFYGTPGARFLPDYNIENAMRFGVRVIMPDRPGHLIPTVLGKVFETIIG